MSVTDIERGLIAAILHASLAATMSAFVPRVHFSFGSVSAGMLADISRAKLEASGSLGFVG